MIGKPPSNPGEKGGRLVIAPWDARAAGQAAGGVGLILTLAALLDFALALYPSGFGNPEWRDGTISQLVAGLPLVTIGGVECG